MWLAHTCIMKEERGLSERTPQKHKTPSQRGEGLRILLHRLAIMKHLVDAIRVYKESALVWNLSRLRLIASE